MTIRTDLQYKNGAVHVRDHGRTDTREQLPELKGTDLLSSDQWGESWKREAGVHSNDPALNSLAESQASIARTFEAYGKIRNQQSPEQTQFAHLKSVANDLDTALRGLATRSDSAQESAKARLESIDREFKDSIKWREQDSGELRAVLRGMSQADRQEIVGNAIESGDGQVLAAVLGAHPTLSGMTADQHSNARARTMLKHRPDLRKLEQSLHKASAQTRQSYIDLLDRSDVISARDIRDKYQKSAIEAAAARQNAAEHY
jgi:hypothetical protein